MCRGALPNFINRLALPMTLQSGLLTVGSVPSTACTEEPRLRGRDRAYRPHEDNSATGHSDEEKLAQLQAVNPMPRTCQDEI